MDLKALDREEQELEFTTFSHQDALTLGNRIVQYAQEKSVAVAVHIERNRVPVFTHLMDGTSEENYLWLFRKKRIVDHYNRSSAYIETRFNQNGATHEEHSLLPAADYQAIGGSLPIRVENVGVVGSVTVGGLTGELDHAYAVEGIRLFLKGK
ncbi:heme-degrading domain-containing protein [Paenibacillus hodogayensis]|uniref:Heme-degrading domain-containing protein n=1 Tax=Paenibacillus hodogayensis TaxID=279208 RepID=A0ABV5VUM6_9BACL